ncbi:hypothetical protein [Chelativorans intermedius]|uniref:Uncharacterized protein n=1 Tax=Chelativorans intermedius TaxID=515947 RepID=A0ABV6DC18_9HYPH|nr:hypothetical protein [Chelativorans intermedius]MCT8999629.1 hypothetical protein [Chelativorans intermedius]
MATVSQLVEMMATVTMTEKKTVNVYARALIDRGALPKSSGRAIAHVKTEHAAKLLLAIALKPKIKVAADVVDIYCRLEAKTKEGTVTALSVIEDLFGAASAGGIRDHEWTDVAIVVFEDRLGIDVHLPASRHSKKSDRVLHFRFPAGADVGELERFVISPNPFFSRRANIPFDALVFICQLMQARQAGSTPQGDEAVGRLLSLVQADEEEHE